MTRVGILGAGFMGNMHVNVYNMLPDVKIVGIADIRGDKSKSLATKAKAIPYYDAEQLLTKPDVTVIDVCLPTYLHKEFVIKAAENGKDVFCEKPIALNVQEADEMIEACKKNKVRFMVGHVIRFWNEYKYLKEVYERNEYGNLKSLVCRRLSPLPTWSWEDWLLNDEHSGGALLDLHIHDTDFILHLIGKNPQRICTKSAKLESVYSHIFSTFTFDDDLIVSVEGGWDFPSQFPFEMSYTAKFEKAVVAFNSRSNPSVIVYESSGKSIKPTFETIKVEGEGNIDELGGYFHELRYFVDHVSHNKPFNIITPEEARHSLAVLMLEKESIDKNAEIII
ncbi:Gfo/Idh/MocA family oxidoreductase [bacterium]|nr:Gfo/Idh/MocA family oxidoreductase [bacterium]